MTKKKSQAVLPEIEIARLERDTQIVNQIISLAKQPIYQSIAGLVILETLQRFNLIGQNVSTAMEVAIATKEVTAAIAPAAQTISGFIPGVKL